MNKYCIIQQEAHPDRCIEAIHGPFETFACAHSMALAMEQDEANYNSHGSKIYHYHAKIMDAVQPA